MTDTEAKLREAAIAATAVGDKHDRDTVIAATAEAIDFVLEYSELARNYGLRAEVLDVRWDENRALTEENARLRDGLREMIEWYDGNDNFPSVESCDDHPIYRARAALAHTNGGDDDE